MHSSAAEHLQETLLLGLSVIRENLPVFSAFLLLSAATAWDFLRHRLPNVLTVGGALLGFVLHTWLGSWHGLLNSLAGFATGLFILLPLYALHWMSAGDVKLMAAAGSLVGWPDALLAVGATTGVGALAALLLIGLRGGLAAYLSRYWVMLKCLLLTGRFAYIPPALGEPAARSFPYAFAVALGTFGALWWVGRLDPFLRLFGS